jgi:hypothetical protein
MSLSNIEIATSTQAAAPTQHNERRAAKRMAG